MNVSLPGAKANLRDYSGHLAFYYLKMKEPEGAEEDGELRECARPVQRRSSKLS